nr:ABC transporter ATP-binding protein [Candidatus Njordarchaeum guaymaensis]
MAKSTEKVQKVQMKNVTKSFPGVLALSQVHFSVEGGEIRGLLGENGAGKTTLMNILCGLYRSDEGEIYIDGKKVEFGSPLDAINLGVGMVHQHFMLIPVFSVAENIALGCADPVTAVQEKVRELSEKYGLKVDPRSRVSQLALGERQRVEIIKALYTKVDIFIFDEPTSVLIPQEVESLFSVLKLLASEGRSIVFITHKLNEALQICDNITVLRGGKVVGSLKPQQTTAKELAAMMVGAEISAVQKVPHEAGEEVLEIQNVTAVRDDGLPALKDVSLSIRRGEILGIAGVAGNGQRELSEVVAGLRKCTTGKVIVKKRDLTNASPSKFRQNGVSFIPEEGINLGLILDFTVAENSILGKQDEAFSRLGLIKSDEVRRYAEQLVSSYDVATPGIDSSARVLSGGNLQKLVVARELTRKSDLLIAAYPLRGLDVRATEFVRRKLLDATMGNVAVLFISEDLDDIFDLSDTIAVIYEGKIMGIFPQAKANRNEVGLLMAGVEQGG